ncbi:hypothetical protein [Salinimicrobium xinjiangense]|uniref:hypothetical protein n=1 Tax=Salinimicrobium xinjiangense TaxID=438596 RepID=UPI0003FB880D|nr:hypothetical protein [Salinimicrobium xinjiangense]
MKDSLVYLKVTFFGLKAKTKKSEKKAQTESITISLDEEDEKQLEEVMVLGDKSMITEVNKTTYKVRSSNYLKNAEPTEALNDVPTLVKTSKMGC